MKLSNTATPASYLAVVTDLQKVRVHCPVCLASSLAHAVVGGLADCGANLLTVSKVAQSLSEVERNLQLLSEDEIDRAMELLVGYLLESLGQHQVDLPF